MTWKWYLSYLWRSSKAIVKGHNIALLVGLLQEIWDHRERKRNTWMRHGWGHTHVLIQRKDSPLNNLSPSIQSRKKHSGKCHSEPSLSVQMLPVQQHFSSRNYSLQCIPCITWEGELAISPLFHWMWRGQLVHGAVSGSLFQGWLGPGETEECPKVPQMPCEVRFHSPSWISVQLCWFAHGGRLHMVCEWHPSTAPPSQV